MSECFWLGGTCREECRFPDLFPCCLVNHLPEKENPGRKKKACLKLLQKLIKLLSNIDVTCIAQKFLKPKLNFYRLQSVKYVKSSFCDSYYSQYFHFNVAATLRISNHLSLHHCYSHASNIPEKGHIRDGL